MKISNQLIGVLMGVLLVPVNLYAGKRRKRRREVQDVVWDQNRAKKRRIDELFEAVLDDDNQMVNQYLRLRMVKDVNDMRSGDKLSLLTAACSAPSPKVVQRLLEQPNVDVNFEDGTGLTPLIYAVKLSSEIVEMLLECPNIDVNKQTNGQESALHGVISWYPEVSNQPDRVTDLKTSLELLLNDQRVDVNLQSFEKTPLQTAVECWPEVIPHLLSCPRLNLDTKGYKGLPLLHSIFALMQDGIVSKENGRESLYKLSKISGTIDLNEIDKDGLTARDWAARVDARSALMEDEDSADFLDLVDWIFEKQ